MRLIISEPSAPHLVLAAGRLRSGAGKRPIRATFTIHLPAEPSGG